MFDVAGSGWLLMMLDRPAATLSSLGLLGASTGQPSLVDLQRLSALLTAALRASASLPCFGPAGSVLALNTAALKAGAACHRIEALDQMKQLG